MDYNNINKKFKQYKLKENNDSMEKICKPKKFKLQPSQKFLGDLFKYKKGPKHILIYHKIGAGKTCTAITIAEKFKKKMKIMVVLPAALIGNFRNELRSKCPGDEYISDKQRKELNNLDPTSEKFKNIIKKSNKKINKYYRILSYHKFVSLCKDCNIKLKNHILIIDEVQNMISESGSFYYNLKKQIDSTDKSLRIVLLSATPMFDKPVELALTLNLLKLKKELPIGINFNKKFLKIRRKKDGVYYKSKNLDKFKEQIKGMISYYRGASPVAFPMENFKVVKCKMQPFQWSSYLGSLSSEDRYIRGSFKSVDILSLPNNFFLGPRMISNISFPNKSVGIKGYKSLTREKLQIQNIKDYSVKFYKIYKKINQAEGPVFIYSNFKETGGLKPLVKFLESHGYKNYKTYGEGKKRLAVWNGDEKHEMKEQMKYVFNKEQNKNGDLIKIILGSPSIKEGVSLLRVSQVHILEPYWNLSRMSQIIGRAIRYCSHKDLPKRRREVDIFLYLATYPGKKTVDQYIWRLAKRKQKLINHFERALKEIAIDCELFYSRNVYKDEEELKCYQEGK
jgi:superfamily II DNA or RNA helicase